MLKYFRSAWDLLKSWLRQEPSDFTECFWMSLNCWLAITAWSFISLCILQMTGVLAKISLRMNPLEIFSAAFMEELMFRLAFLGPFIFFWGKRNIGLLLTISFISSVLFGFAHGHLYNLFIQGIGGFIICLFFIKACETDYTPSRIFQYRALMITAFAHTLHNAISARMLG